MDAYLVTNGTILTMDPARPEVEAFAVIGERIVAAGSRAEAEAVLPRGFRRLDLAGATCLPGFNEAHNHMINFGLVLGQVNCRYPAVRSIEDIVARFAARAGQVPPGTWIRGRGYDDNVLAEHRHPTRADLDRASSAHPFVLTHSSGHMLVANSLALRLAGVTRETPDPPGGQIVRDEHGEPTGLLQENAMELVERVVPAPTLEEMVEALRRCNDAYVAAGITSSQDAGSDHPLQVEAYQRAVERGVLRLRTSMMIRHQLLPHLLGLGIKQGFGDARLRVGPVKLFADGSLIGRTAAVSRPFLNDPRPDNYGLTIWTQEELDELVWQAHAAGFQVATHAIGDRAIEMVLDAYERALARLPRPDHRHRIEHCGVLRPDLIGRIARVGVLVVSQPIFIVEYGDGFIRHLGLDRIQLTYPFRSLLDAGIRLVFSTDCPVSAYQPLRCIQSAVLERTASGRSYALEEAITVAEALPLYTVNGAYATFEEREKGMLRPGMLADFVVLERDPRSVDPEELAELRVLRTVIGGETVYEA
ncbi:MAG: amidohydrolase [Thermomicrobium sp.]|nr:amidohydrolase [Thermomicrobium sp.]